MVRINRKEVKWHKYTPPLYKLNFDGDSQGNLRISWTGVCIRKFQGELITAKAISILIGSNNQAEVLALYYGLMLSLSLDITNFHI